MMFLAAITLAGCLAVGAGPDRIVGRDLAALWPALAEAHPDAFLAPAPAPGVRREFPPAELLRLAARWNVAPPAGGLCMERAVARLDPARLLEAMQRRLPEARIEILDFSQQPVPDGELEFPRAGLRQTPAGELWAGTVRYAETRRLPVWAKVRVRADVQRVIAVEELRPGSPIRAGQVRLETRAEFPASEGFAASPEEAIGKLPRLKVPAGAPLLTRWLVAAPDIARGDMVRIEAADGGAHLMLEAEAEASGSRGQAISFRNPTTGRRFWARVEGPGRASVKGR